MVKRKRLTGRRTVGGREVGEREEGRVRKKVTFELMAERGRGRMRKQNEEKRET